jgi:hypothetical protein
MKAIDLSSAAPTLTEVLELAENENVIVRTPEGREFVVAEIDDFDKEVAATARSLELTKLLSERSAEQARLSLDEVKRRLAAECSAISIMTCHCARRPILG